MSILTEGSTPVPSASRNLTAGESGRATIQQRFFPAPAIVIALLLAAAAFWGANKQILGLFHDDGIYTVVGKALANGDGYRIVSLPTAPAQSKYPILYSTLVAGLWALAPAFPQNIALLKSLNVAILVGIFILAVVYYRREAAVSTAGAIIFALVVCVNPILFSFTDFVLSDLLLVLFALTALVLVRTAEQTSQTLIQILWLGVVCGAAFLTRSAAVPLVFAGLIYASWFRGLRGASAFLLPIALLVGPWFWWELSTAQHPDANSLFAYYTGYGFPGIQWAIVWGNLRYFLDSFDLLYLAPLLPGLGLFVFAFTAIGMIACTNRNEIFSWSFFLSSLALLLVWPFQPARYLAPLVPLLA
ncbi:MAG TPA: hypothetical protein VNT76_14470, partial [Candidatus Binatus sp.]|nr:hypothetical protein [Candidatus Binatus sp.]